MGLRMFATQLPNICGAEEHIRQVIRASRTDPLFLARGTRGFDEITSAFAIALHMHQPLIPHLLDEGFQPRVMLDYSGTLLYCLRQMGATDVLDALARLTADERDRRAVEWRFPTSPT
jgi:hypothetical protein